MVDEVVAREGVDDVALAAQVRAGDRDQLAVALGRRERGRAGQQRGAVGGVQGGTVSRCADTALTLTITPCWRSPFSGR